MPGRDLIKKYYRNRYYHIYNRGINKDNIFNTQNDQDKFLIYLSDAAKRYNVRVIKYALMHNHFHILIRQKSYRSIEKLMRSLGTRYAMYFNFKYERVGRMFQGPYRARLIKNQDDLINVSYYIDNHKNQGATLGDSLY